MNSGRLLTPGLKGFPHGGVPVPVARIGDLEWNALDGRFPLPLALLKRTVLEHNLRWMQQFVEERGVDLAPHCKTTMSPELFTRQLDAGAWGLTFANVAKLAVGVTAEARNTIIANQVFADEDLAGIQALLGRHADLRIIFLVDSEAQLALIEAWLSANAGSARFETMVEIGMPHTRTGCRTYLEAISLAGRMHASPAVSLVGIECYEGLRVKGRSDVDVPAAGALMDRIEAVARYCDQEALFATSEVIVSARGSSIFDLVAGRLKLALHLPVRGLLRSGCYVTHDHGYGKRMQKEMQERLGCRDTLHPALEVWTQVQSRPEPGLAILAVGRRDVSFDIEMPIPFARAPRGSLQTLPIPPSWKVTALNDQHGYMRWDPADDDQAPVVGERVGPGISHPCTTFDKRHWMPIVEDDYRVTDAVTIHF